VEVIGEGIASVGMVLCAHANGIEQCLGELLNCCRFQYILNAATSPATRMSEETLTYLNQGSAIT